MSKEKLKFMSMAWEKEENDDMQAVLTVTCET